MIFIACIVVFWFNNCCYVGGFSFEKSPRHDSYVPRFEAELAQFCEKLVGSTLFNYIIVVCGVLGVIFWILIIHFILLQVMDLDRRVRRGRERLAQEVEAAPAAPLTVEKSEQLSVVEEKIKNLLEQVEALGEAGKVDEAEALMRKVRLIILSFS